MSNQEKAELQRNMIADNLSLSESQMGYENVRRNKWLIKVGWNSPACRLALLIVH